jgi:hypothetical protein
MESHPIADSILAAAALGSTMLLMGAAFLFVLRTPRFQYTLRFLVLSVVCIAATVGLWTAVLRSSESPDLTGPGIDMDASPHPALPESGTDSFINRRPAPADGVHDPAAEPTDSGETDR